MTLHNPDSILTLLFLSALAVSGAAILWRKILVDHPRLKAAIQQRMGYWSGMLLCGSCFTYWLGLAFTLLFDPLSEWSISAKHIWFSRIVHYGISWMALSSLSLMLRFGYVLLQQTVHDKVHAHGGH